MKKEILLILSILILSTCQRRQLEHKYDNHQTYTEFLQHLQANVDTMSSEFDKISYIREKTAELIDVGYGVRDAQTLDKNWPSWVAERYYNVFLYDSATVHCGGAACFLKEVYEDLGYKATTYDMGCAEAAITHQLTLVWSEQEQDYWVQDAFLNVSVKDNQNQPLPFNSLISLLAQHKSDEIMVEQGDYEYIPSWDSAGLNVNLYIQNTEDSLRHHFTAKILSANNLPSTYLSIEREYHDVNFATEYVFNSCLKENNLPNDLLYMFLLPLEHNDKDILQLVHTTKSISAESNSAMPQ